jgi:hypothetical protein
LYFNQINPNAYRHGGSGAVVHAGASRLSGCTGVWLLPIGFKYNSMCLFLSTANLSQLVEYEHIYP